MDASAREESMRVLEEYDLYKQSMTDPSGLVRVERLHVNWSEKAVEKEDHFAKLRSKIKRKYESYGALDWAGIAFPCINWLRIYDWRSFLAVYGLYTAFAPVLAYALFGSSRQLAVGPVAVMSLLLSVGLQNIVPYVNEDPNNPSDPAAQALYNSLAIQASFLVGIIYMLLGVVRLGFITNFLSHSVISGFTSGAAIIIGFSQLKYVVGYPIRKSEHIYESIYDLFANISQFQWYEFVMSIAFLAILLGMKHAGKNFEKLRWMRPLGPLTVTVISIALVYGLRLDLNPGVKVVGNISGGLPPVTVQHWFPMPYFSDLITVAITMTAVVKIQLLTNAGIIRSALASIVISGVIGLVEFHEATFLFKVAKLDCLVWVVSFVCTLMLGVEIGLAIAVGLAMLIVIYQSAFPNTAILGRIPRTTVYRNRKQYPEATTVDGVLLIRIDAPIYFANVAYIKVPERPPDQV
eukprot:scaffold455_cov45-Prasinocladus_malaysianus.AAC.1